MYDGIDLINILQNVIWMIFKSYITKIKSLKPLDTLPELKMFNPAPQSARYMHGSWLNQSIEIQLGIHTITSDYSILRA